MAHAGRAAVFSAAFLIVLAGVASARSITTPRGEKGKPVTRGKTSAATAGLHLDGTEKRIAVAVDKGVPSSLALLERAVNVNSGTMNFAGVRETGRLFEPELAALGFTTEWVDGASWGRAGHLIARRDAPMAAASASTARRPGVRDLGGTAPATSPKAPLRVLLIGHLDTVFEKDSPFQKYTATSEAAAAGPGVSDMKGGDVVMLLALRALKEAGALDAMSVAVMLSGDEESAGMPIDASRRHLRELADWADVAIGFEDGDDDPATAVTSRRGSARWRLEVTGKPSHSSQIFKPEVGAGAVFEATRILQAFRDSLGGEEYLTFNPGLIAGGTDADVDSAGDRAVAFGKDNVVAEHATVKGDLRALTTDQAHRAMATMRRIVAAGSPHTSATITIDERYPPLSPNAGNDRLLAIFDGASRDLGLGPVTAVNPSNAGAADVSFCEGRVGMAMDGVGLMGDGGHTVKETGDLRTLPMNAKRVAITLRRLAEEHAKTSN